MHKRLSIIIPCLNCQRTLKEAVDSCFAQGLKSTEFEIIMVDDGSTDNTKGVMQELAHKHPEIKIFSHKKNKGGGATRNAAVEKSAGEVIFCLDSDDLLPPLTLTNMLSFLDEKKCDAVAINRSIKFTGTNPRTIERIDTFSYAGEKIPFESLLQKNDTMCPLYSTFMITSKAFDLVGGYPTEHGFDTQSFAWRFLGSGLTAYTCPDAEYLHRTHISNSYYMREYNAGRINLNWKLILNEYIFLFSPEAQTLIKNYDVSKTHESLIEEIRMMYNPWAKDFSDLLKPHSRINQPESLNSTDHKTVPRNSIRGIQRRISHRLKNIYCLFINTARPRHWRIDYMFSFGILILKKKLKLDFDLTSLANTTDSVDIVIPTISKDYALVTEMVSAIRKNLNHCINKIYIVSRAGDEVKRICDKYNWIFVDERNVLGYGKEKITYIANGVQRNGWMFQQLLKLSGDRFVEKENYIIIDSDTILIRPYTFLLKNSSAHNDYKFVFYESEEWNQPYFDSFKKIFGYSTKNRVSYTSHMMIFNVKKIKEMKAELERCHHRPWDDVYTSTANPNDESCISDYDTYANWMKINHPEQCKFVPFYNKGVSRKEFLPLSDLEKKYSKKYSSLSFHHYL